MTTIPEPTPAPDSTGARATGPTSILIGVDDSPESLHALDLAASLGAPQGAALTIVHVRPTPMAFGFGPAGSIEYAEAEAALDRAVTAEAAARLGDYPGPWQVRVRSGNVRHELLALADEVEAELIVVGHRSHGTVRDAILGSVAASIVHHSRRSVLVAVPPA
jgi:nucleotide-binding universal stress UspA family protein